MSHITALPPLPTVQALRRPESATTYDNSNGGPALLTDAVSLLIRLKDRVLASLDEEESEGGEEERRRVGRLLVEEDARGR